MHLIVTLRYVTHTLAVLLNYGNVQYTLHCTFAALCHVPCATAAQHPMQRKGAPAQPVIHMCKPLLTKLGPTAGEVSVVHRLVTGDW